MTEHITLVEVYRRIRESNFTILNLTDDELFEFLEIVPTQVVSFLMLNKREDWYILGAKIIINAKGE